MAKRLLKNKLIKIILLESNKHLGEKYEIVDVKPIFAKNVLIPNEMAILATPDQLHKYNEKINKTKQQIKAKKDGIDKFFLDLNQKWWISISRKTNEKWILYDKVWPNDIVSIINEEYNIWLQDNHIKMKKNISTSWEHLVVYKYKDLEKNILVNIKSEK